MMTLLRQFWISDARREQSKRNYFLPATIGEPLVEAFEFASINICGVSLWYYKAPGIDYPAGWQIACLGGFAGLLAIAYRRFGHSVTVLDSRVPPSNPFAAAASTAAAVFTVILFCVFLLPNQTWTSLGVWARWWAATSVTSSLALHFVVGTSSIRSRDTKPRVAVIGTRDRADEISELIREVKFRNGVDRYYDDEQLDSLIASAKQGKIDILLLAMANAESSRIGRICELFADVPIRVCLAVDPTSLGGAPQRTAFLLLDLAVLPPRPWVAFQKRILDILGSAVALVLTLPVLVIASAAIRIESEGPVIFRQWRSGRAGRPFKVLKLRTMYIDNCDPIGEKQTSPGDPRVTRVGRFLRRTSVDELPQLINVLRGDMSLVGPRAHPVHMQVEGRSFGEAVKNYHIRHRIRPGITGWAQINGSRGGIYRLASAQRRTELDLFYVRNLSILLDFYIIFRTICGGFIATKE